MATGIRKVNYRTEVCLRVLNIHCVISGCIERRAKLVAIVELIARHVILRVDAVHHLLFHNEILDSSAALVGSSEVFELAVVVGNGLVNPLNLEVAHVYHLHVLRVAHVFEHHLNHRLAANGVTVLLGLSVACGRNEDVTVLQLGEVLLICCICCAAFVLQSVVHDVVLIVESVLLLVVDSTALGICTVANHHEFIQVNLVLIIHILCYVQGVVPCRESVVLCLVCVNLRVCPEV